MTTYIITTLAEATSDMGHAEIVEEEQAQELVANFFADETTPDGEGILIRKADYMGKPGRFGAILGGEPGPGVQVGNHNVQHSTFTQTARSGDHSVTVQAGGDVRVSRSNLRIVRD